MYEGLEDGNLGCTGALGGMVTAWIPDIICHNKNTFKDAIGIELEDPKIGLIFLLPEHLCPFL